MAGESSVTPSALMPYRAAWADELASAAITVGAKTKTARINTGPNTSFRVTLTAAMRRFNELPFAPQRNGLPAKGVRLRLPSRRTRFYVQSNARGGRIAVCCRREQPNLQR